MNKILRVAVALPGILFVSTGLRWLIDPSTAAAPLGMSLLNGLGLSTQIGDLAAFFLTLGACILMGLITSNRVWYYPSIMLLGIAAMGRVIAWLLHDAALATSLILLELAIAALLTFAANRLGRS